MCISCVRYDGFLGMEQCINVQDSHAGRAGLARRRVRLASLEVPVAGLGDNEIAENL